MHAHGSRGLLHLRAERRSGVLSVQDPARRAPPGLLGWLCEAAQGHSAAAHAAMGACYDAPGLASACLVKPAGCLVSRCGHYQWARWAASGSGRASGIQPGRLQAQARPLQVQSPPPAGGRRRLRLGLGVDSERGSKPRRGRVNGLERERAHVWPCLDKGPSRAGPTVALPDPRSCSLSIPRSNKPSRGEPSPLGTLVLCSRMSPS